jgi:hypothetical protein
VAGLLITGMIGEEDTQEIMNDLAYRLTKTAFYL